MYIINPEYICTWAFFHKAQNTRSWKYIPNSTIVLLVQLPTQITEALHRFHLLGDILRHFRSSV